MTPADFLRAILIFWFAAFALLVAHQLATGKIQLKGLLTMDGDRPSPERLQLFMTTLIAVFAFAQSALTLGRFPAIPDSLLTLFAASHIAYLGGKTQGR